MSDSIAKWKRVKDAIPTFLAAAAAGYSIAKFVVPLLKGDPSSDQSTRDELNLKEKADKQGTVEESKEVSNKSEHKQFASSSTEQIQPSEPIQDADKKLKSGLDNAEQAKTQDESDVQSMSPSRGASEASYSGNEFDDGDFAHPRDLREPSRTKLSATRRRRRLAEDAEAASRSETSQSSKRTSGFYRHARPDAASSAPVAGDMSIDLSIAIEMDSKGIYPDSQNLESVEVAHQRMESDARLRCFSAFAQDTVPLENDLQGEDSPSAQTKQIDKDLQKKDSEASHADSSHASVSEIASAPVADDDEKLRAFIASSSAMFSSSSASVDGGELLLAMPPPPLPRLSHCASGTIATESLATSIAGETPRSIAGSMASIFTNEKASKKLSKAQIAEMRSWEAEESGTPLPLPRYKRTGFREPTSRRGRPQLIIVAQELPIIVSKIQHSIDEVAAKSEPLRQRKEGSDENDANWWRIDPETGAAPPIQCQNSGWKVEFKDFRNIVANLAATVVHSHYVSFVGLLPKDVKADQSLIDLLRKRRMFPVVIPDGMREEYEIQFCRTYLWPVFHYLVPSGSFGSRWRRAWIAYDLVNRAFARTVLDTCVHRRAAIWMNDYPVLLVPLYLRPLVSRAQLCFMSHTPFPSSDIYRVLPSRDVLLKSLLASDLLGFHVFDYARHFLSACQRVLSVDYAAMDGGLIGVNYLGHTTCVFNAHTGVPFDAIRAYAMTSKVVDRARSIRQKYLMKSDAASFALATPFMRPELDTPAALEQAIPQEIQTNPVTDGTLNSDVALQSGVGESGTSGVPRVILLAIDSLALNKAVVQKLQAYGRFLEQNPRARDQVVLVLYLVEIEGPQNYAALLTRPQVTAEINRIQKAFGPDVIDVHGLDKPEGEAMSLLEYISALQACSVLLTTSFWEGLNLTPIEATVATSPTSPFVLILSEFVGCARAFSGALRVNPWAAQRLADTIRFAVTMPIEARRRSFEKRLDFASRRSFRFWCERLLSRLLLVAREGESVQYVALGPGDSAKVIGVRAGFVHIDLRLLAPAYRHARQRILLFDYDGTLTGAVRAYDEQAPPPKAVLNALRQLSEDPANIVFLLSGRGRPSLVEFFGHLPELGIAAEKGYFIRWPRRLLPFREAEIQLCGENNNTLPASSASSSDDSVVMSQQTKVRFSDTQQGSSLGESSTNKSKIGKDEVLQDGDMLAEALLGPAQAKAPTVSSALTGLKLDEQGWELMLGDVDTSWRRVVLRIVYDYWRSTDGSWIELKDSAISWHFEETELQFGNRQATELKKYLDQALQGAKIDVVRLDSRVLEVRPRGISKGNTTKAILRVAERYFAHQLAEFHRQVPISPEVAASLVESITKSKTNLCIQKVTSKEDKMKEPQRKVQTEAEDGGEAKELMLLGTVQHSTVVSAIDVVTSTVLENVGTLPPLQLNQDTQEVSNPVAGIAAPSPHTFVASTPSSVVNATSSESIPHLPSISAISSSNFDTKNSTAENSKGNLSSSHTRLMSTGADDIKRAAMSARRFMWVKTLNLAALRYLYRVLVAGRCRPMIFAIGDDKSDESTFSVLAQHAASLMPSSTTLRVHTQGSCMESENVRTPTSRPCQMGNATPLPSYLRPNPENSQEFAEKTSESSELTQAQAVQGEGSLPTLTLRPSFSSHPALAHSSVPMSESFTLFDIPPNALDLESKDVSGAAATASYPVDTVELSTADTLVDGEQKQSLSLSFSPTPTLTTLASSSMSLAASAAAEVAAPANANIFTVKVRCQPSEAQFYVNSENEAVTLLCGLASISRADLHFWRKIGLSLRQAQIQTRHVYRVLKNGSPPVIVAKGNTDTDNVEADSWSSQSELTDQMRNTLAEACLTWSASSAGTSSDTSSATSKIASRWTLEAFGMGAVQAARLNVLEVTRKEMLSAISSVAISKKLSSKRRRDQRAGIAQPNEVNTQGDEESFLKEESGVGDNHEIDDEEEEEEEEEDDGDGVNDDEFMSQDNETQAPSNIAVSIGNQLEESNSPQLSSMSASKSSHSQKAHSSKTLEGEFEKDNVFLM